VLSTESFPVFIAYNENMSDQYLMYYLQKYCIYCEIIDNCIIIKSRYYQYAQDFDVPLQKKRENVYTNRADFASVFFFFFFF
jgi:hypothetical protein